MCRKLFLGCCHWVFPCRYLWFPSLIICPYSMFNVYFGTQLWIICIPWQVKSFNAFIMILCIVLASMNPSSTQSRNIINVWSSLQWHSSSPCPLGPVIAVLKYFMGTLQLPIIFSSILLLLIVVTLSLLQVSSPTIIVERAGSFAWTCKNWRVREEFARTLTSAIGLFSSTELPLQRAILPPVCSLAFTYPFFCYIVFECDLTLQKLIDDRLCNCWVIQTPLSGKQLFCALR